MSYFLVYAFRLLFHNQYQEPVPYILCLDLVYLKIFALTKIIFELCQCRTVITFPKRVTKNKLTVCMKYFFKNSPCISIMKFIGCRIINESIVVVITCN